MNNEKTKPRNVGHGPRVAEKPKDLKIALSKMVKYLKSFVPFIIVALILSVLSSIFSIIGPNKLSDLTNIITDGIKPNINETIIKDIMQDKSISLEDKQKFNELL